MRVALIDYGAGNLHSVYKALERSGAEVAITADPAEAERADALVLPGQGHFRQVTEAFLESGFEPVVRALGVLAGTVKRFPKGVSVPQMGWNQVFKTGDPALLEGVPDGAFVYFANSYYVDFEGESVSGTTTEYGGVRFKSAVSHGRLYATQFHTEKSQAVGHKV